MATEDKPKFTPGPWKPSTLGLQVVTGDGWSSICHLKGGAQWADGRGDYEQEYAWQREEANAHVIAAAPDMYEALRGLLDRYVGLVNSGDAGFWDPEKERPVSMARAALAKAKGHQS